MEYPWYAQQKSRWHDWPRADDNVAKWGWRSVSWSIHHTGVPRAHSRVTPPRIPKKQFTDMKTLLRVTTPRAAYLKSKTLGLLLPLKRRWQSHPSASLKMQKFTKQILETVENDKEIHVLTTMRQCPFWECSVLRGRYKAAVNRVPTKWPEEVHLWIGACQRSCCLVFSVAAEWRGKNLSEALFLHCASYPLWCLRKRDNLGK